MHEVVTISGVHISHEHIRRPAEKEAGDPVQCLEKFKYQHPGKPIAEK